jgi:hypothetical protein
VELTEEILEIVEQCEGIRIRLRRLNLTRRLGWRWRIGILLGRVARWGLVLGIIGGWGWRWRVLSVWRGVTLLQRRGERSESGEESRGVRSYKTVWHVTCVLLLILTRERLLLLLVGHVRRRQNALRPG